MNVLSWSGTLGGRGGRGGGEREREGKKRGLEMDEVK